MFQPETQDYLGGTQDDQMTLVTLEPFYNDFTQFNVSYSGCVDKAASTVANTLNGFLFSEQSNYDEENVTTETVKNFGKNQVILWYGHGGFNSKYHSYLVTGEAFNSYAFQNNSDYYKKYVQGYVIVSNNRLAITSKYIDRYCGDMDNSLVFLTACQSGQSDRLANSFLKKGATAVLGYNHSVFAFYGADMVTAVITNMLLYDTNTNSYTTLLQALQMAQRENGKTDSEFYDKSREGAELLLFGGQDAENYRLCYDTMTTQTPQSSSDAASTPAISQQIASKEEVYQAYLQFLENYAWISYCPSDLSEISPEEYESYWMGAYTLIDIDQNGVDELVIKAGQSVADTSQTFFTYQNGAVQCLGSMFCGNSSLYRNVNGSGAVICELHGGLGKDTYIDLANGQIVVTDTEEYNYESPDYVDSKIGSWEFVASYSVHDFTPFL